MANYVDPTEPQGTLAEEWLAHAYNFQRDGQRSEQYQKLREENNRRAEQSGRWGSKPL